MPPLIEIKGLGSAVADAKRGISDVRAATSGLSAEAAELVAAVNDVRQQIKQARDDLHFEASTLGNSEPSALPPAPVSPVTPAPAIQALAIDPPLTEAAAVSPTLASQMQVGTSAAGPSFQTGTN